MVSQNGFFNAYKKEELFVFVNNCGLCEVNDRAAVNSNYRVYWLSIIGITLKYLVSFICDLANAASHGEVPLRVNEVPNKLFF